MWRSWARSLWLVAPVLVAGLGHVVVLKIGRWPKRLARPIDGGRTWRGRPLLGANKTWRGPLLMASLSSLGMGLQSKAVSRSASLAELNTIDFERVNPWVAGAVYGLGYSLGELPNSFLKRQLGIPPGEQVRHGRRLQYLVDQADSVVGCLLSLSLFHRPARADLLRAASLGLLLHLAVDQGMWAVGIKQPRPADRLESEPVVTEQPSPERQHEDPLAEGRRKGPEDERGQHHPGREGERAERRPVHLVDAPQPPPPGGAT
jgi:hypothetical protein